MGWPQGAALLVFTPASMLIHPTDCHKAPRRQSGTRATRDESRAELMGDWGDWQMNETA